MEMLKFNSIINDAKNAVKLCTSFSAKTYGKALKKRLDALLDINQSVVKCVAENFDFLTSHANCEHDYYISGLGRIKMTAGNQTINVFTRDGKPIDVEINDVDSKTSYSYDKCFVNHHATRRFDGSVANGIMAAIMDGNFSGISCDNLADIEHDVLRAENHYNNVYLPGFENFLMRVKKQEQAIMERQQASISRLGGSLPTRNVRTIIVEIKCR